MDLSVFFQEPLEIHGYGDELAAIKSKNKAMSVFTGKRGDEYFEAIEKEALDLKLVLVTLPQDGSTGSTKADQVSVFVTNTENLWRVQVYFSFLKIMRSYQPWSNGAEHFQSFLLGYSDDQIREWIKYKNDIQVNWGNCTVYCIIQIADREKLDLLGNRCFHPECGASGIKIFIPKKRVILKTKVNNVLPAGLVIGRVAVAWRTASELFQNFESEDKSDFALATLAPQAIPAFNQGIRSGIEFFDEDGWH